MGIPRVHRTYGLIARSIETDDARDRVVFHLDPAAHFSDGARIVAADVLFSFNLLKSKGPPSQRAAYALVKDADAPDDLTVRFDLAGADDRELPLILEAFRPEQLAARAAGARGGPREAQLLYSVADLSADFAGQDVLELAEASAVLEEGALHVGASEIVRAVVRRV